MNRRVVGALGVVAATLLVPAVWAQDVVRGNASYRERLALPAEAVFEVRLEDVSRADAPARVLSLVEVRSPVTPIAFEIPYRPAAIEPGHRYRVSGRIRVGQELWFITDTNHPVFDEQPVLPVGGVRQVELSLVRVSVPPRPPVAPPPPTALVNLHWKLVRLGAAPVRIAAGTPEPHIVLQATEAPSGQTSSGSLSGFAGCNRMLGSYRQDGAALSFAPAPALTQMACEGAAAKLETGFTQAITATAGWRLLRGRLELLDAAGAPLARFEPRELQ